MKQAIKFILCLLLPLVLGGISGYFTAANIPTWYVTLNKPGFNPPNYLFGPVWTVLYLLMGFSFYKILSSEHQQKRNAIIIFIIQLSLNLFWSIIFFNMHAIGAAAIEIVLLWISILLMIVQFYKINRWASFINIPYLLWVSFATLLNLSIYYLNR